MKIVDFSSSADLKKCFQEIEVDPHAQEIMLEKFQFVIIEIPEVRNVEANILKQEMLVLGGEAALNRHSISCTVPTTPVLLSGTKKMFRILTQRIENQVGDLPQIAKQITSLLFSS
jgi:dihydropteroate synthase